MPGKRVREVYVELVGDLKLLVGGKNGYVRVRGGQGPNKNKFQGYTSDKKHSTAAFDTPREAAMALAALERDLAAGLDKEARKARKGFSINPLEPGPIHRPIPSVFASILFTSYPDCILSSLRTLRVCHVDRRLDAQGAQRVSKSSIERVPHCFAVASPHERRRACADRLQCQYPLAVVAQWFVARGAAVLAHARAGCTRACAWIRVRPRVSDATVAAAACLRPYADLCASMVLNYAQDMPVCIVLV